MGHYVRLKALGAILLTTLMLAGFAPMANAKPWPSIPLNPLPGDAPDYSDPLVVKDWTFVFYLDADNNLGTYAYDDLVEMMQVGSSDDVNVVVLYDTYADVARSYYIVHNGAYLIEDYEEVDMGSSDTLSQFLNDVILRYPSDHILLDIWDHGDDFRGACKDYHTGDPAEPVGFLYHTEILEALSEIGDHRVDILAFDACIEGMIEVAYYYQGKVDYLIGSEDYVPYHGFPYDTLLSDLEHYPTPTSLTTPEPGEYYTIVVDDYME